MTFKSTLLTAAAVLSLSGALNAPVLAAPVNDLNAQARYNIPAQDLGHALVAFSRASGLAVSVDPALTQGRQSSAVNGQMRAETALRTLIGTAPLAFEVVDGAVILRRNDALAATDGIQEVVVVGQRLSQQNAIAIKQRAQNVVDATSADEMGRMADKNLAENIERLPGVSLKYDQGEGRYVSIRGVDGALNNVTVNGVDLGSPDGDTRQLPLDVIGGQLLSRVEVIKVVTPDMDAQAVGGTVNLVPQSPFDFKRDHFGRFAAQVGWHELNSTNPVAADAAAGAVWGPNREMGFLFGANYSKRDYRSYGIYPDDWSDVTGFERGLPTNIKYTTYDLDRERLGLAANFEMRPAAGQRYYLQALYSQFKEEEYRQRYRLDFGTVTPSGDGYTGTATGGERRQDLRLENKDKSVANLTFGGENHIGQWTLDYQMALGRNELDEPNKVWTFRSSGITGGSVSSSIDMRPFIYTVTPVAEVAPSALQFRQLTVQRNKASEDISILSLNARRDFSADGRTYVKAGLRLRDASKMQDNASDRYDRGTSANRFTLASNGLLGAVHTTILDDVTLVNQPTINADAMKAYTNAHLGDATMVYSTTVSQQQEVLNDYTVDERVSAAYVMGAYAVGRLTVSGGVRAEKTEGEFHGFETRGLTTSTPTIVPVDVSRDYTNVLPNLIVRFDATDRLVLRAAYSQTVGRPAYPQMTSGQNIDETTSPVTISGGNPDLKPYLSKNIDLSAEWYFARGGLLSAGAFSKAIDDPIFSSRTTASNVTFAGTTYTSAVLVRPANAGSADIKGIELNYQQQFRFLPGVLKGLGISANATFTDSEMNDPAGRGKTAMPRQSDTVYGVQLFYQDDRIEAALAYHHSDAYLDTIGADTDADTYFNDFNRLDAKLSYAVSPRLTLTIEGQNLNDEPLWEYQGRRPERVIGYEKYGRTAYLGLRARF